MSLTPRVNEEVVEKCEKLYQRIKKDAACVSATSDAHVWDEKPSWFDEKKFKKGQETALKYFTSVFLSHTIGLTVLFNIPTMITPLAVTRTHASVSKLFTRYLAVFIHVKKWYETDPYEKGSLGHKSLKMVNNFHRKVGSDMNKSVIEPGKNPVWISQYDMAVTVWCVIAPVILDPKKIGFHGITREEIENLMHVWACIGRLLGVEDRFNIMTGSYDEAHYLCTIIKEREYKPIIEKMEFPSSVGFETCKGIAIGLQPLSPYVSLQGFMRYWYSIFDFKVDVPVESPLAEKAGYILLHFIFRLPFSQYFFSVILRYFLDYCDKNRKSIAAKLAKLYPDDVLPYIPPDKFQPKELLARS
ncbi:uncharacterized protein LOC107359335 [Tetranychus urticae]|uniref:uncharacterized protein LOC107359335 n=1 Tax=Tetranychus urticae TaxID=32264 RepID=UPI00077BD4CF|nr:uncharacterized protein LOC107359335 [Tetranychus urticae]